MTEEVILNYTTLDITGFLSCKVPHDVFTAVKQEVDDLLLTNFETATPYNNRLAGSIEHEYTLCRCEHVLNKFFKQVVPQYWLFNNRPEQAKKLYKLNRLDKSKPDLWVNLQKKYEYNPLHNHSGELSFVMYIKIPYSLDDELKQPHVVKSNSKNVPSFSFLFQTIRPTFNTTGTAVPVETHKLYVDKNFEGVMLIFPAWLQHQVTPFYTSDEYRISVSGNLVPVNNG